MNAEEGTELGMKEAGDAGEAKGDRDERNGSMAGAFLAAPGHSPSFASLGDTGSFESRHGASESDTFGGFDAPKTPEVGGGGHEVAPAPVGGPRPVNVASRSSPTELKPIIGNVDSFTFNRTPGTSTEPYVTRKKIPGHELLEKLAGSQVVNAASPPAVEESGHGDVAPPVEEVREVPKEPEPVVAQPEPDAVQPKVDDTPLAEEPAVAEPAVVQPEPDAAQVVQPKALEAPLPEEPAVAQPGPDAAQVVQPKVDETPLPEEPAVAAPAVAERAVVQPEPDAAQVVQPKVDEAPLAEEPAVAAPAVAERAMVQPGPDAAQAVQPKVDEAPLAEEPAVAAPAVAERAVVQPGPDAAQAVQPKVDEAPLPEEPAVAAPAVAERAVVQPGPDAAQAVQPKVDEAPLPEEPAVAAPAVAERAVVQPGPDAAQVVQPKAHEAALPEEPAVAIPATGEVESQITESAVAPTADDARAEKAVATGSDGRIEEVAEKSVGDGIETTDEKEVGSVKPPETIAFRNVEAEKEVPTSSRTETPKPGPFGKLTTISTKKWRSPTDVDLKTMVVIPEYLSRDMENAVKTKGEAIPEGAPGGEKVEAPTCPIIVFINSKSGGRLGPELMKHFEELISSYQVYDLANHSPSAVLQYGLGCLDRMAKSGDECAKKTRESLRILVAGGDGTVGWVLSSVGALRELPDTTSIPPVGVIPLGTGNDLSRSFGWGGEFSSTSKSALKRVLVKALGCNAAPLDTWNAVVMPAKSVAANNIEFPHAMHPQHHVPLPSPVAGEKHAKDEKDPAFEGLFFNYFSVGMDAQVAYGFHHLRDEKPWLARGRAANQMIYSSFGCTQGWFCTACSVAPRARGVSNILKLLVKKRGSKDWEDIHLPSNIRAVVICNLKSYAGGRNPWGKPSSGRREKEGFEEQRCDDGLLEVMGLKDGWHSAFVLLEVSTAVRLCQAEAIKLELNGKARKKAYLQMDGEPWMQPMGKPDDETNTVVMIEKLPHPSLLLKR